MLKRKDSRVFLGFSKRFFRFGFTLAEVLITLGIIGVVAAMTIPNLIANTKAHTYRSQFKKTISTLSQAARLSQAQYGFDYAGVDFKCGTNPPKDHPESNMTVCALLNGSLTGATYFANLSDIKDKNGKKYSVTPGYFMQAGPGRTVDALQAYLLADGTIVAISKRLGIQGICSLPVGYSLQERGYDDLPEMYMSDCWGLIDVNGASLPNKEVTCSSGSQEITSTNCIVKNDAKHMTDVFPVRFHDGIVEPASAAARYVLKTAK
ncbi:prepilin-type N-terminal cleavage/methylation domain-containing protein [bacterium]|nr:prepilin-type N-terminal cleavage/methylation domain-containing protein [bacterium]